MFEKSPEGWLAHVYGSPSGNDAPDCENQMLSVPFVDLSAGAVPGNFQAIVLAGR